VPVQSTCSQYAVDALTEYGLIRGGRLAVVRLLSAGRGIGGGWDPIPERRGAAHVHSEDAGAHDLCGTPASREESSARV